MADCCRFAPSTTGEAHPGTLLAGLLCWLDARSRDANLILRLEDLDSQRSSRDLASGLQRDLEWFGLDWDQVDWQHQFAERHHAALDRLAAVGRLYPCQCSRSQRQASGRRAPDGGWAYDNRCRDRPLPAGGWRASSEPLRVALPDAEVAAVDESGLDLSQTPAFDMGDPIVRRRDGAIAYHLAVVVDDAASGVTRVVRGRDLAASTATQIALQRLFGVATPTYRHHLLLLEQRGAKFAKFHGAVGAAALRGRYTAAELCGRIAWFAGLQDRPQPCRPRDLVDGFAWARTRDADLTVTWDGIALDATGADD